MRLLPGRVLPLAGWQMRQFIASDSRRSANRNTTRVQNDASAWAMKTSECSALDTEEELDDIGAPVGQSYRDAPNTRHEEVEVVDCVGSISVGNDLRGNARMPVTGHVSADHHARTRERSARLRVENANDPGI